MTLREPGLSSNIYLFGEFQGIVDFDAKVADCAFKLAMPEQQLAGNAGCPSSCR